MEAEVEKDPESFDLKVVVGQPSFSLTKKDTLLGSSALGVRLPTALQVLKTEQARPRERKKS